MKPNKPHIKRSVWRRIRSLFSRVRDAFSCTSKISTAVVEPFTNVVKSDDADEPDTKPMLSTGRLKRTARDPEFLCGRTPNKGGHNVGASLSEHAQHDVPPRPSISAPRLETSLPPQTYTHLPDCSRTVLGKFHQGNIPLKWSPSEYQGTQCTTISFSSIVVSSVFPVGLWTPKTLNRIVRLGDRLHHYLVAVKHLGPKSHYLAADEMPSLPEDEAFVWPVRCTVSQEFQGLIQLDPANISALRNMLTSEFFPGLYMRELEDAVGQCLVGDVQGCIITFDGRTSAIFRNPVGGYSLFDSHAKNVTGKLDSNGRASLLKFPSLGQLVCYLRSAAVGNPLYSITGFKVERSN